MSTPGIFLSFSHVFCVYLDASTAKNTKLKVDWRMGVEAMNWDTVAKKDNLDALSIDLKKLEETVKHVHNQVLTMKKREQEMRDLNGMSIVFLVLNINAKELPLHFKLHFALMCLFD